MKKEDLIHRQEMMEVLGVLDGSEEAIIDKFKGSTLVGGLYPIQWGGGGITFESEDSRSYYFMLNPKHDDNGIEARTVTPKL
jgi:hypothetical protein